MNFSETVLLFSLRETLTEADSFFLSLVFSDFSSADGQQNKKKTQKTKFYFSKFILTSKKFPIFTLLSLSAMYYRVLRQQQQQAHSANDSFSQMTTTKAAAIFQQQSVKQTMCDNPAITTNPRMYTKLRPPPPPSNCQATFN